MVSEISFNGDRTSLEGLNPCFSGGWSRSETILSSMPIIEGVLILVLVEDGLGELR